MKSKLLHPGDEQTYVLIFETGDEVVRSLTEFAREKALAGSHFTGLGALRDVTLGFFDWETKKYEKTRIDEQLEVLSLVGDIALQAGDPKVHAHIVLGRRDGSACGGHLMEARVRPTLEVVLVESPRYLRRVPDPETGLALIKV